jgi:ABC-2 type transport system ATP-binding protein
VTVILTTHYIEEAQEMADRVGVIDKGRLLLVDDTNAIMARMGRTEARFRLVEPLAEVPGSLCAYPLHLEDAGRTLAYRGGDGSGRGKAEVAAIAQALAKADIAYSALDQSESSLEDIFVGLVEEAEAA